MPTLEQAIQYTVAYADVFNYPLTRQEIHWFLWGAPASAGDVAACLQAVTCDGYPLSYVIDNAHAPEGGFYTLPGRESIVPLRLRREAVAATMWTSAWSYARLISQLPFVKMIALTGSLAMGNVEPGADIDFLIVTERKRLWLCRAAVIALVRWAAQRGDVICPNYFLSNNALIFGEQNFYTAHEFAQMIPLYGLDTYRSMLASNCWTQRYLPNADGLPCLTEQVMRHRPDFESGTGSLIFARRVSETVLRSQLFDRLEAWEMRRKLAKFKLQWQAHIESSFGPDCCKGHFSDHMTSTLERFKQRAQCFDQPRHPERETDTGAGEISRQELQALHV